MTRERLPDRREAETFHVSHAFPGDNALTWFLTVGRYPDGRVAEIFLDGARQRSALGMMVREAAVLASIALQHGATVDELRAALMRDEAPAGEAGLPHSVLGTALDLIAAAQMEVADGNPR